ncbi:hypothetical protein HELRODRAFT_166607 [Helobdella robusta]|uniref:ASX DEUBAD domain-containing protein n=1 Tax=Helobdella robusta TaxID=6412 RepID=T1EYA4_HELRO|nr:hypothetical protein HELRODRAFT_166607 [Helobdella robusta]ESO11595.1 hypothetical protein HELRODRAFT_166607 [Helobdella robusta]
MPWPFQEWFPKLTMNKNIFISINSLQNFLNSTDLKSLLDNEKIINLLCTEDRNYLQSLLPLHDHLSSSKNSKSDSLNNVFMNAACQRWMKKLKEVLKKEHTSIKPFMEPKVNKPNGVHNVYQKHYLTSRHHKPPSRYNNCHVVNNKNVSSIGNVTSVKNNFMMSPSAGATACAAAFTSLRTTVASITAAMTLNNYNYLVTNINHRYDFTYKIDNHNDSININNNNNNNGDVTIKKKNNNDIISDTHNDIISDSNVNKYNIVAAIKFIGAVY